MTTLIVCMDHWHAESLLIRMISIFAGITCGFFFFLSAEKRRNPSGSLSCQFYFSPAPCSLPLNSQRSVRSEAPPSPPCCSPPPSEQETPAKGDIPTHSSSSPHGFTLYYRFMLSFLLVSLQPSVLMCFSPKPLHSFLTCRLHEMTTIFNLLFSFLTVGPMELNRGPKVTNVPQEQLFLSAPLVNEKKLRSTIFPVSKSLPLAFCSALIHISIPDTFPSLKGATRHKKLPASTDPALQP